MRLEDETHVDENGVTWTRPTAWAYMQVCKARDKHAARVRLLEDALRDEISEIAALTGPCQFGRIERCVCFKCRRGRSKQALAAKEKK